MGRDLYPVYGDDFASNIETAEILLSKIKNRKSTDNDLKEFLEVTAEIVKYASENKD